MGIRRILAVWTAKLVKVACQAAGKQGVTLAGQIALRIDPNILRELSSQVREKIFVTCGTNGKTTTNNLLCSAIEAEGKKGSLQSDRLKYVKRCGIGLCVCPQAF